MGDTLDWTLGNRQMMAVCGYMPLFAGVEVLSRAKQLGYHVYQYTMPEDGRRCFCTTSLTGIRESGTYELMFSHKLCNLSFSLVNQNEKPVSVTDVRVYGLCSKGKYQEERGWYDIESEDRVFSLDVNKDLGPLETMTLGENLSLCVLPQALGENFRVEADWRSADDNGTWTFLAENGVELKEGTRVTLPLGPGAITKSAGAAATEEWTFTGDRQEVSYIQDGFPINISTSINSWENSIVITVNE